MYPRTHYYTPDGRPLTLSQSWSKLLSAMAVASLSSLTSTPPNASAPIPIGHRIVGSLPMSIWPGSSLVEVVVEALEGRALAAQHAAEPGARRLPLDEEAQAHKQRQPDKAARGGAGWVVLYVRQSTLLLPSAPRVGDILGASSAQACV